LERLVLDSNRISGVFPPEVDGLVTELRRLGSLSHLSLSNNNLTFIAPSIASLQGLEYLQLENNMLSALPETIGDLKRLARYEYLTLRHSTL
jgi:Leucine-rich repeat (LRR) protein